jgi:hypothetical protein
MIMRLRLGVAVLLLAGMARGAAADEIIDRVLAVAAGDLITESDVAAARELGLIPVDGASDPAREILSRLIDRSLMLAEVDRYAPPEPSVDAVDGEVETVRSRFATAQAFDSALARVGMDEKYLRGVLRQDLRIRAYLDQRFTIPSPSDDEIGAYYREHPQAFTQNGQAAPLEQVRGEVARAVTNERRQALVSDWIAGLRRRATITEVDLTVR